MAEKKEIERQPMPLKSLAELKRAIKPGVEVVATYHANHPALVGVRRIVTKVQTNGFFSKSTTRTGDFGQTITRRAYTASTAIPSQLWIHEAKSRECSISSRYSIWPQWLWLRAMSDLRLLEG